MSVNTKKKLTVTLPVGVSFEQQQNFINEFKEAALAASGSIQIDCSKVAQVTSTHVNMLWKARSIGEEHNCNIHLINVTDGLMRVLEVLDLTKLFIEFPSSEEPDPCQGITLSANDHIEKLSLTIALDSRGISSAQLKLKSYLEDLRMAKPCVIEILTMFYEMATNVRLHSGLTSKSTLKLNVTVQGQKIILTFCDQGVPFDPTASDITYDPISMMSNYQKRGLGLIMIRRMADSMRYQRTNSNENKVILEKVWR